MGVSELKGNKWEIVEIGKHLFGGPLFRGLGELKSTAGQLAVVSGEVGSGG